MRVVIVNNMVPFLSGGAEALADNLVVNMSRIKGIEAEVIRIPFKWEPAERLVDEILMCSSFRLNEADVMVGLKFPAYLVPHPRKRLWLLHQFRQAYDLWDSGETNIPDTIWGRQIRNAVITADNRCFSECERIFGTKVVATRLERYNGFRAETLLAPLNDPELFSGGDYGDYVFCGGRINSSKRQHLLVEAMCYTKSNVRLVVAGPADSRDDADHLKDLVCRHGLSDKVHLELRFVARDRLGHYVNESLACAYVPVDEDSLGYVTMEAFSSSKAVLTVSDAGGLLDIVKDGETGIVTAPNAKALAEALDRLHERRSVTIAMGRAGNSVWRGMNLTWPKTIERLLA